MNKIHSLTTELFRLFIIFFLGTYELKAQCPSDCTNDNTFVGISVGNNTTGSANTFVGLTAGLQNTSGEFNTFLGTSAGFGNNTGRDNTFLGVSAGQGNTDGILNVYLGRDAARNTNGNSNVIVGASSGMQSTTGSNNVIIGNGAGPTALNASVSDRLYIDVITSNIDGDDDPLIYGEFDNDFVRINGTFEVTAGLTNPSSIKLKDRFAAVAPMLVLDKINQLDISEWSYKHDPDVRHIGPTAESFYEAFGLGTGGDNISTIDADGVSLIAIQALTQEIADQQEQLAKKDEEIKELREQFTEKDQEINDLQGRLERIEQLLLSDKNK